MWTRRWPAVLAWTLAMLGLAATAWLDHLVRHAGRPDLAPLTADAIPVVLALLSATTVGTVVVSRRPDHPVGWLLLALGLVLTAAEVADAYVFYGARARPGALPGANLVVLYRPAELVAMLALIGFVLVLTPTGSLPSPRWRWWAKIAVTAPVVFVVTMLLLPEPLDPEGWGVDNPLAVPALGDVLFAANDDPGG